MNIQEVCRVCLKKFKELKSLHENLQSKNRVILEVINFVANIKIKLETGLPDKICKECESNLDSADVFKRRCLESETILGLIKNEEKCEFSALVEKNEKKFQENSSCFINPEFNSSLNLTDNCKKGNESGNILNYIVKVETERDHINEQTDNDIFNGDHEILDPTQDNKKTTLKSDQIGIKNKNNNMANTDSKNIFSCTYCDKTFIKKCSYAAHIYRHHNPKNFGNFVCSVCKKVFLSHYNFKKHLRTHKPKIKKIIIEKYPCKTCKQEFSFKSNLKKHFRSGQCNQYKCKGCERNFSTQESLDAHKAEHVKDKYKQVCPICGITLKTNAHSLLTHMRRHQNIKAFECDQCDKNFVTKQELKVHKRSHSSARPYLCTDCGSGFTTTSSLRNHRDAIHSDARPHCCDLCTKTFKTLGSLKSHRPVHLGEKPFSCPLCARAFPRNYAVIRHLRTHARDTPRIDEMIAQMRKNRGAPPKLAKPEDETQAQA